MVKPRLFAPIPLLVGACRAWSRAAAPQERLRMAREDEMSQKSRLQAKVRLEMEQADREYKQKAGAVGPSCLCDEVEMEKAVGPVDQEQGGQHDDPNGRV